ncbi:long-chain acyl-CoA synthetase [Novosphingobium sp. BK486]|nr:long-chain acyl-CoA synthetase [Novosphingobium sp. BK256]MBB3375248.1 long-chain acyl-CoA synthetase [Novosphingobium sp. BK280]MBB3380044.1 long-chain acyl-CoA synthetase [Novosphingobium sp. BK258]MBB3421738.1 long-chain acyl-CoA synthetase [Novosphingobium sp. BK267]MBB3450053.1 long-chain acyl-CoA synthetase [Novosphingobium sp. BK352]MBB3478522.1 long-chain acyl-CoA synthetase [Novosphingobium sp. BK369]MBB3501836.1 long-chain acyl-CoA synthetase [Novosphingobium sp. BK336]MBB353800
MSVGENQAAVQVAQLAEMPNLVSLFLARAAQHGDAPFLSAKRQGTWVAQSWRSVADQVCLLAQALRGLGLNPGDRVMLVSENRPEWCIADIAIMAAGLVTVPTYTTNTARDHLHILENSGARAIIVSNAKLAQPLLAAALNAPCAEHVIGIEPLRQQQAGTLHFHDWETLLQGDAAAARAAVSQRIAAIRREDLACIIYTSGTGGAPRGVRQHHGAILANVAGAAQVLAEDFHLGDDQFLSFLPLSHAYEHTGGQWLPIGVGARIAYAESLEKLASNIEEVRPTIMVVVPRLFEVLRARIIKQIEKQGRVATWLMDRALAIAAHQEETGHLRLIDRPLNLLIERTLRPKVRARFGGRIKALVSGGAPLNPEVGLFFEAMGLTMLQGYGQTEAGPVIACNRPAAGIRMDTVGPPLAGVEVAIAPDGEILVRGELVMHGYWHNDAETARAIQDGWLHTGDIGHIDGQGRIKITDRKKDMIVNDKGDNVSPQKIEGMLTLQPEIAQAMVSGDKRPYVVGLIVPDAEWAMQWSVENDAPHDLARLADLPAFRSAMREAVDRVNRDLSVIEKVRQFTLADEPFAIANEELTPSLKIRRHKIRERYGARMDALYKG